MEALISERHTRNLQGAKRCILFLAVGEFEAKTWTGALQQQQQQQSPDSVGRGGTLFFSTFQTIALNQKTM